MRIACIGWLLLGLVAAAEEVKNHILISALRPVVVVLPQASSETERYAAGELIHFVHEMTGWRWKLGKGQTDQSGEQVFRVEIGKTQANLPLLDGMPDQVVGASRETFFLRASDERLSIVGGSDRGTLYGVYEFLESQGCRWFFPGEFGELIPKRNEIRIPPGLRQYEPHFWQREISPVSGPEFSELEGLEWAVRNRLNRVFSLRGLRGEIGKRGGFIEWQWLVHNYPWIMPNEKYFEEHPEYYALHKGRRLPLGKEQGNVCTTNPEVIDLFADFGIRWFENHPNGSILPLSPPDGRIAWCEGESCRKLGGINFFPGKKGSMSRRHVVFVNEIAKRVGKVHPDRRLLLLAYQNYIDPVPDLKLEPNVVVQVAHYGDFAKGLGKSPGNLANDTRMRGWASMADPASGSPGIWDYFLLHVEGRGGPRQAALPFATTARDTVRFLSDLGSRYYFTQAGESQVFNPLVFYALTKLLWNPNLDFDALLEDFCQGMYGSAAVPMENYWRLLENAVQDADWAPVTWPEVSIPSPNVFTPTVVEKADALLREAEQLAKDPLVRTRLQWTRESFEVSRRVAKENPTSRKHGNSLERSNAGAPSGVLLQVVPTSGSAKPDFVEGPRGKALKLSETDAPLSYPGQTLSQNAGSVSFAFFPGPAEGRSGFEPLVSQGNSTVGWFFIYYDPKANRVGLLQQKGTKPFHGADTHYHNVSLPLPPQSEGSWHHVAFVWAAMGPGRSVVIAYLNGEEKEAFYDLTLCPNAIDSHPVAIGYNSANLNGGGRFNGMLDDLWILRRPLPDIRTIGKTGSDDLPEGTLLRLEFEGSLDGERNAMSPLTDQELEKGYSALIEGLYERLLVR